MVERSSFPGPAPAGTIQLYVWPSPGSTGASVSDALCTAINPPLSWKLTGTDRLFCEHTQPSDPLGGSCHFR